MQLTINCTDETTQVINLHNTFALEKIGHSDRLYMLSREEIIHKANITAQSIVGEALYSSHKMMGIDDLILEARTLKMAAFR